MHETNNLQPLHEKVDRPLWVIIYPFIAYLMLIKWLHQTSWTSIKYENCSLQEKMLYDLENLILHPLNKDIDNEVRNEYSLHNNDGK
jgi:hypothetical protein